MATKKATKAPAKKAAPAKAQRPPAKPKPKPTPAVEEAPAVEPGKFPAGPQAQMTALGETEPRIGVPEMHAPTEAALASGRLADRFP